MDYEKIRDSCRKAMRRYPAYRDDWEDVAQDVAIKVLTAPGDPDPKLVRLFVNSAVVNHVKRRNMIREYDGAASGAGWRPPQPDTVAEAKEAVAVIGVPAALYLAGEVNGSDAVALGFGYPQALSRHALDRARKFACSQSKC